MAKTNNKITKTLNELQLKQKNLNIDKNYDSVDLLLK